MRTMVPLISSSTAGPLGAVHLPRLWIKSILHTVGALPEEYWFATKGFDDTLLTAFGIDAGEFIAYVETTLPDYPKLEAWIVHRARSLDAARAASNGEILTREKPAQRVAEHQALLGCDETVRRGVLLNDLDDWQTLRDEITGCTGRLAPIVPAISSTTVGPLGAAHLPRLWLTTLLRSAGALPFGYDAEAMDRLTLDLLGVDYQQSASFLVAAQPTYVVYERWIREHARNAGATGVAAVNAAIQGYRDDVTSADLRDWQALHVGYLTQFTTSSSV